MLTSELTGDLPEIIGNEENLYEGNLILYFRILFYNSTNLKNPLKVKAEEVRFAADSAANSSEMPNSLLAGKIQGISPIRALAAPRRQLKRARNQFLTSQFPTHPNREFFAALQGIKSGDQGSFRRDQGIPPSSAIWRSPLVTNPIIGAVGRVARARVQRAHRRGGSRVRIVSLRRRDRCEPDFLDQGRSGPNGARAGGAPRWRLLGTR